MTRETHRQRILAKLRAAEGLWVDARVLAQMAGSEAAALIGELIACGQDIEIRQNPFNDSERQYRHRIRSSD